MIFGDRLRLLREEKGYSQKEFAKELNISPAAVSHFENGTNYPKLTVLIQIMHILECDANCLFQDYINTEQKVSFPEHTYLYEKFERISASEKMLIANLIELAYVGRKNRVEEESLISRPLYSPLMYEGAYFYLGEPKDFWMRPTKKNQNADFCLKVARKMERMEGKTGSVLHLKKEAIHHNELGVFQLGKRAFLAKLFITDGKMKLKLVDEPDTWITVTKDMPIISMGKVIGRLEGQYYL